ncbi:MAG TPA: SoxR reducing system RseC family protein [bacterium]
MENEVGTIVKIKQGKMLIELNSGGQCNLCGAAEACVPVNDAGRKITLPYSNTNLKVGNKVRIIIKPKIRIISAVMVFVIPILFLIIGYFIGIKIFETENLAIVFSFVGLLLSFGLLWMINKIISNGQNFIPAIVEL